VIVGDSLGAGRGDPVQGLELVGWAERLSCAIRSQGMSVRVTNLARSGLTTAEIARTQVDHALQLRPDLIVLAAGGNDLLGRAWDANAFRRAYAQLVERLVHGGAQVFTTTWHDVPRAVPMPRALARRFSRRLAQAGNVVREVSNELGATCIDFWQFPDLLDAGCYSRDGIHPNARGYVRVTEVVADALARHAGLRVPRCAIYTHYELLAGI
jgi:lysophospholipase L1-like esterase